MRLLLILLALSSSLLQEPLQASATPCEAEVASTANRPPGKFGRWVNRRTKPIGKVIEIVTPFNLVKKSRIQGCGRCFPADTRISLPSGTTCAISELRVGQIVLGWNPATNVLEPVQVEALATVIHDSLRTLSFTDGRNVTATADHPFWVKNVGWASLSPDLTTARYATGTVRLLQPGDSCLVFNGTNQLSSTQLRKATQLTTCGVTTYTITQLSRGNLFFANGLAVGIEGDRISNKCSSRHRRLQAAFVAPTVTDTQATVRAAAGSE